jgi:hypothetical protein
MVFILNAGILYADLSGLSSGTPGASNSETIVIIFFALYTLMVVCQWIICNFYNKKSSFLKREMKGITFAIK